MHKFFRRKAKDYRRKAGCVPFGQVVSLREVVRLWRVEGMLFYDLPMTFFATTDATSFAGHLSEVSLFIRNGITCLQLSTPQNAIAITLCPYETILD